jgi:hypothetical protein
MGPGPSPVKEIGQKIKAFPILAVNRHGPCSGFRSAEVNILIPSFLLVSVLTGFMQGLL